MTEQRFITLIGLEEIPIDAWFEYYREMGGKIVDLDQFEHIFSIILWNESVIECSDGEMRQVTIESAHKRFYDHYKNKFGLWT